jgi:hypothetical protein
MSNDFNPSDLQDFEELSDLREIPQIDDIPYRADILPDGRETLVIGEPERFSDFNHLQGDNPYGFRGTCGLVSCEDVLRQFGVDVTEADVVKYAAENGLCAIDDNPMLSGGTTVADQAKILSDFSVPAHPEFSSSMEDLAAHAENGQGIIIEVNAGILWDDPNAFEMGQANHAIVVTGVARDPATGDIQGFFINDSGRGYAEDSGRFIDGQTLQEAWLKTGGSCVVTDVVR